MRTNALKWPPLVAAGLTGGISSGKSTIARMFADLGATILSADEEGRAVVAPGEPALAEIVAAFGPAFLLPDGTLDRRALGRRIFASAPDRKVLNRITHPRIGARLADRLRQLAKEPPAPPVVVLEAAVLIEASWANLGDRIMVVVTQPSTQTTRLIAGLGLSASEAEARIHAQLPMEKRLRYADYRLPGEGPLSETRNHVLAIWEDLCRLVEQHAPAMQNPGGGSRSSAET